jgi:hypothetical protein
MKYLSIGFLIVTMALYGNASGAGEGARVQENAVKARHMRGEMQGVKGPDLTLLLRVETRIENGKQNITATATAHSGEKSGAPIAVDVLNVRVTEPAKFSKEGGNTNTAVANGSAVASDSKFKTVVADAMLGSHGVEDTRVTVRIPGDAR